MTATATTSRTNATKAGRMLANATSLSKPAALQVTVASGLSVAVLFVPSNPQRRNAMRAALIDCILAMAVGIAAGLLIHPSLLFGSVGTRANKEAHK